MTVQSSSRWPWIMLVSRISLFIGVQAIFALGFLLTGSSSAWEDSANWWPFFVTITNIICVTLMVYLLNKEGKRFWDIFRIQKKHIKSDLLALLGITIIMGPIAFLPNIWLGSLLFENPQETLELLVRPLPLWAAVTGMILFPLTQGMAEIPTYFSYTMPRFEEQGMSRWLAVTIPAMMLGLQHIGVPFLFNVSYLVWRGLMFIPFAFLVGIVMRWRPRLLPYLAIIHVLMDLSFAAMLLDIAY